MADVFVTTDAFFLQFFVVQYLGVCLSRPWAAGLSQQRVMAVKASFVGKPLYDFLTNLFAVVFPTEVVLDNVLNTIVGLGRKMGEIFILGRKMAVDTFYCYAFMIGAVSGKLPCAIGNVHLVTFCAAILRLGHRSHRRVEANKA